MAAVHRIASDRLTAEIAEAGAELQRLTDAAGRDWLWAGDPAVWAGRAPILFPIVGTLNGDRFRWRGQDYALPRHGFARRRDFRVVERDGDGLMLRLESDAATRAVWPFDCTLDMIFTIRAATLTMTARVANRSADPMPASFGFHPALRWPLPYGTSRAAHQIVFERDEPAPIRRPVDGLLSAAQFATPVRDRHLLLHDDLFEEGALVFDTLASRSVVYGEALRVDFPRMPHLGIWTKPGAGYVCIEPWQGHASPEGFDGELADKPGVVSVGPGATETFAMSISVSPPGS